MFDSVISRIRRFALLALAAVGLALLFCYPPAQPYLKYFHVICMVAAVFMGRAYIQEQDIPGWALQNGALLAHAAALIINGVTSK